MVESNVFCRCLGSYLFSFFNHPYLFSVHPNTATRPSLKCLTGTVIDTTTRTTLRRAASTAVRRAAGSTAVVRHEAGFKIMVIEGIGGRIIERGELSTVTCYSHVIKVISHVIINRTIIEVFRT